MQYIVSNELCHYGVLGMKWGKRKIQYQAVKDAKEFARAKMFYGEGAGTRRKLIKNTVTERSKNSDYANAFKDALNKQDMAKHVEKAKFERKAKDTSNSIKKTGRGVVNIFTGHPERVGAGLAVAAAAVTVMHKTKVDKIIVDFGKDKYQDVVSKLDRQKAVRNVEKMFGH